MLLRPFILTITVAATLSACGARSGSPPATFEATRDPLTRLVPLEPQGVLRYGATVLREMGFEISDAAGGGERVWSEPLVIQSSWRGDPIAQRVLCGIGSAATSDPQRVSELTNTIPIELRLGYEVERHAERTAATILFVAQGRRSAGETLTSPTMACTLTYRFVEELFGAIDAEMQADSR